MDKKVDLKIILSKKIQTFHKNYYRIGLEKKVFSGIRYTFLELIISLYIMQYGRKIEQVMNIREYEITLKCGAEKIVISSS